MTHRQVERLQYLKAKEKILTKKLLDLRLETDIVFQQITSIKNELAHELEMFEKQNKGAEGND